MQTLAATVKQNVQCWYSKNVPFFGVRNTSYNILLKLNGNMDMFQ